MHSGHDTNEPTARSHPRRLRARPAWIGVIALLLAAGGCANPGYAVDGLMNIGGNEQHEELELDETEPTLVVLQHGIWRSRASLWRMERALESHGYEVLNQSYPSTRGTIEEHAALLEERLEAHLATRVGPAPRLCFVGHSMGGLVINAYLQRPDARHADACVFLGTPHRGAMFTDKRKDWLLFPVVMGDQAAYQLSPSDPFYETLGPVPCPSIGTIIGGRGDDEGRNAEIPGDDDGKVSVTEAHLPEETASVQLTMGHTSLSHSCESIESVLHFLKYGSF